MIDYSLPAHIICKPIRDTLKIWCLKLLKAERLRPMGMLTLILRGQLASYRDISLALFSSSYTGCLSVHESINHPRFIWVCLAILHWRSVFFHKPFQREEEKEEEEENEILLDLSFSYWSLIGTRRGKQRVSEQCRTH